MDNLIAQKENKSVLKINFGSCYGILDRKSDIFKNIADNEEGGHKPDLFMWGGDAVYVDKFEAIF
jgi:hypothetical protein